MDFLHKYSSRTIISTICIPELLLHIISIQNSQAGKEIHGLKKPRCGIKGGSQEMAVMIG